MIQTSVLRHTAWLIVTSPFHKSFLTNFLQQHTSFCGYFGVRNCLFWLLEEAHIWWMCCTDLIDRKRLKAVAEGVPSWQSLFSCARMCSPYGPALIVPLPSTNRKGIPGGLTVHSFWSKYAVRTIVALSMTMCVSGQPWPNRWCD